MDRTDITEIALLSIHPKYAHAILNGEKLVEFRKTKFQKPVQFCVMYSTLPEKKIIGFFKVDTIEEGSPEKLWKKYGSVGKISEQDYLNYYKNNLNGVAISISGAWELKESYNMETFRDNYTAPQSFMYLNEAFYNMFKFTFLRHISMYRETLYEGFSSSYSNS